MSKDQVCGMEVTEQEAAAKVEHIGKTYYFCSVGCKETFEKNPTRYAEAREGREHGGHH